MVANAPMLMEHFLSSHQTGGEPMITIEGACSLLGHLIRVNAKRAADYRASLCLLACIASEHGAIKAADAAKEKEQKAALAQAIKKIKQEQKCCQISGRVFGPGAGIQAHAHHLMGKSENPHIAAEVENLVLLDGVVHQEYHAWAAKKGMKICIESLSMFAWKKGYDGPLIQKLKQGNHNAFSQVV